jgi:hypothetical protein
VAVTVTPGLQQQVIANLVTVDSVQRLGKTLLQLARKLCKKDPRSIRIEPPLFFPKLSNTEQRFIPNWPIISEFTQHSNRSFGKDAIN